MVEFHQKLLECVQTNDVRAFKRLIREALGNETDLPIDMGGNTLLLLTTLANRPRFVQHLLSLGANPNLASNKGVTPLSCTIVSHSVRIARLLLKAGADLKRHAALHDGNSILFDCVGHNVPDLIALFVEAGANPEARNDDGETPLFYALRYGSLAAVKALAAAGASVSTRVFGISPVEGAVLTGQADILAFLLESGASPDVRAAEATTDNLYTLALRKNRVDMLEILNRWNADPYFGVPKELLLELTFNAPSEKPFQLLLQNRHRLPFTKDELFVHASGNLRPELFHSIINADVRENPAVPSLVEAGTRIRRPLVKAFVRKGVSLDAQSEDGRTALMMAVCNGNKGGVKALLEFGADPRKTLPCDVVLSFRIQRYLRGMTLAHCAVFSSRPESLPALLDAGTDFTALDSKGRSLLHYVRRITPEIRSVLARVPELDINLRDADGHTPLQLYLTGGRADFTVVKAFITLGADPHALDGNGDTLLIRTFRTLQEKPDEFLWVMKPLSKVLDINARNSSGSTLLHILCGGKEQNLKVLRHFLALKPDLTLQNRLGLTARELAERKGYQETVTHLCRAAEKR